MQGSRGSVTPLAWTRNAHSLNDMATVQIPEDLRHRIRQADRNRCAYCLTSEANSGIPLTIDHIQPLAKGGSADESGGDSCGTQTMGMGRLASPRRVRYEPQLSA